MPCVRAGPGEPTARLPPGLAACRTGMRRASFSMRESLAHQRPAADSGAADRVAVGGLAAEGTTSVLVATAAGDDGGPAALLAWEQTTLLARLVEQMASLG